ncbi:PREDICTED: B3 domain-containing protein REM21 [Tarenaya hassleriana]|uniref:B3 domain-containing protein REM21 n=1 Tax=Tarenaya hassleriana TaxID=28532 RepID=UPI00053C44DC|nr:PREDICTED: B3 domain-containing protein REM21 [Tarenaya hassleriana]
MADKKVQRPEFFKVYIPHINSKILHLPLGFVRYIPQPHSDTAIIRNQSGNSWRVGFTRRDGFACFESGWADFVRDNELKPSEFMVFVYKAPCTFLVSIYGVSTCREKRGQVAICEILRDDEEDESETSDEEFVPQQTPRSIKLGKCKMGLEKGKSRRPLQVGQGSSARPEAGPAVEPELYLDNPSNLFFVTGLKNRNFELLVPSRLMKDFNLKFSENLTFIDPIGTIPARRARWRDNRVCLKEWTRVCRRNNLKAEDKVICELKKTGHEVESIKVHIIRKEE